MKIVKIGGIAKGYSVEHLGIERMLVFHGSGKKDRFDDTKYEYESTGAKITSVEDTEIDRRVTFEISDENAEKWLPSILKSFNKRYIKITEVK